MKYQLSVAHLPWLMAIFWSPVFCLADADVPSPLKCAEEITNFDGTSPLHYATIKGDPGSRVYFHRKHPSRCISSDNGSCNGTAYVIPGDTVAVGPNCGSWTYAQYIGPSAVTVGWIDAAQLTLVASATRASTTNELATSQYRFSLTQGQGNPVCEAYLQRINQAKYERPPFCERPADDQIPGFAHLERVWVPTDEINHVFDDVTSFILDEPMQPSYTLKRQPDGSWLQVPRAQQRYSETEELATFRFAPQIDIDNDGLPLDVLIWNNERRGSKSCGLEFGHHPVAKRSGEIALIMKSGQGGIELDRDKTKAVFGHPAGGRWIYRGRPDAHFHSYFRPLGISYDIFRFHGKYYFDTFFDSSYIADFKDQRFNDPKLKSTLGVFLHENGSTQQVCEYYLNDSPAELLP